MEYPNYADKTLSTMRLQECQGTVIGGMKVAASAGMNAEEYGYQMMAQQKVDWSRAGSAEKIATVFWQHYQTTYGFGDQLSVTETEQSIVMAMPSLSSVSTYQLNHWAATATELNDIQSGYWRAIKELCGVNSELSFDETQDRVTIFK
ncbi:MAG: hypothetical protein JKY89_13060 [Immundisolibacteraceae bacterium]|nr:hypothetical protein [Immundisolibacteraceae bacterium]